MTPRTVGKEIFKNCGSVLLLDGPMGTELERRGFRTSLPLWSALANAEAAHLVCEIHKDFLLAGANVLTANTFRTTYHTLDKAGKASLAPELTRRAVELAHQAIRETRLEGLVAASLAPLEDCYQPALLPPETVMRTSLDAQIDLLENCDADLILAETMINFPEARYIARRLSDDAYPFMMSFTTDKATSLLDGTPIDRAVEEIAQYAPEALLLNCRPPETLDVALDILLDTFSGPVGIYANGPGRPDPVTGWKGDDDAPAIYVQHASRWLDKGIRIVGGCCGTTPETIRQLHELIESRTK